MGKHDLLSRESNSNPEPANRLYYLLPKIKKKKIKHECNHTDKPLKFAHSFSFIQSSPPIMLGRIRSTRLRINVYHTLKQQCCYATAASEDPVDHHKRLGIHDWPTSSNPTAYEIFGLSSKDMGMSPLELNKILKKRYVSLVKIYHPDTSLVLKHKGKEIDTDLKRKRFDMIQESYQILKNPRRRIAYNRFQTTTWEQQGMYRGHDKGPWSKENFEAHRRANAHRRRYDFKHDEEFWHAATWQDYYQMKYKRAPPTQEELDKNKYKILAGVLLFGAVGFGLQMINAVDNANKYLLETQQLNLKSMQALNDSYDNYGQGHSEADKVRRFLANRRSTMKLKQDHDDEEKLPEPNDDELLRRYAVKRLESWDRVDD